MAKTLNVRTSVYDVTATVVVRDNGSIVVVDFSGEGFDSKSVRAIKKSIIATYKEDGIDVIAIENITVNKRIAIHRYRVDASISDIVDACINSGLTVTDITDNTDTNNEDENITE